MIPIRKAIFGGAVVAATLGGGAVGATLLGTANAATTSTTTAEASDSSSSSTSSTATATDRPSMPAPGTAEHEAAEKEVTGDAATKAKAAALESVDGTAGKVTTNYTGDGYEVTVTKSDGTEVEVHLDSSFNVQQGPGGPGRTHDDDAADETEDTSTSSSTS
jgi:hypothetical protein